MTRETFEMELIVARIIDKNRRRDKINPSWVATEAMLELQKNYKMQNLQNNAFEIYRAAHLQLRQVARGILGKKFESEDENEKHGFFTDLQIRYPAAHSKSEEPSYVLLEYCSDADLDYNIERLDKEIKGKTKHRNSLIAYKENRVNISNLGETK